MTDKQCRLCGGKGKVRSGQWGGFWDTCVRCGGSGQITEQEGPNIGVIIAIILIILAWLMYAFDLK